MKPGIHITTIVDCTPTTPAPQFWLSRWHGHTFLGLWGWAPPGQFVQVVEGQRR